MDKNNVRLPAVVASSDQQLFLQHPTSPALVQLKQQNSSNHNWVDSIDFFFQVGKSDVIAVLFYELERHVLVSLFPTVSLFLGCGWHGEVVLFLLVLPGVHRYIFIAFWCSLNLS